MKNSCFFALFFACVLISGPAFSHYVDGYGGGQNPFIDGSTDGSGSSGGSNGGGGNGGGGGGGKPPITDGQCAYYYNNSNGNCYAGTTQAIALQNCRTAIPDTLEHACTQEGAPYPSQYPGYCSCSKPTQFNDAYCQQKFGDEETTCSKTNCTSSAQPGQQCTSHPAVAPLSGTCWCLKTVEVFDDVYCQSHAGAECSAELVTCENNMTDPTSQQCVDSMQELGTCHCLRDKDFTNEYCREHAGSTCWVSTGDCSSHASNTQQCEDRPTTLGTCHCVIDDPNQQGDEVACPSGMHKSGNNGCCCVLNGIGYEPTVFDR